MKEVLHLNLRSVAINLNATADDLRVLAGAAGSMGNDTLSKRLFRLSHELSIDAETITNALNEHSHDLYQEAVEGSARMLKACLAACEAQ